MFRKILLIFILILALLVAGGILYVFLAPMETSNAINAIPQDAAFIFEIKQPHKTWKNVCKSKIWETLQQNAYVKEQSYNLEYVDSLITSNEYLLKIFKNRPLYLSIHKISPADWDYLAIIELKEEVKILALKEFMKTLLKQFDYKFTSRKFDEEEIWELTDKSTNEIINILFYNNLMIISYSAKLVEEALISLKEPYFVKDHNFMKAYQFEKNSDLKLIVPVKNMQDFITIYTKEFPDINYFSYLSVDVSFAGEWMKAQGKAFLREDTTTQIHVLAQQKPVKLNIDNIINDKTALITSILLGDYEQTQQNILNLLQENSPEEYESYIKNKEKLEKLLKINLQEDLYSWIGGSISPEYFTPLQKISNQPVIFVEIKDTALAKEKVQFLLKQIKKRTPFKPQTENYYDFAIYKIKLKTLFKLFLGKMFKDYEPVFTFYDKYLLVSPSELQLKEVIDFIAEGGFSQNKDYEMHKNNAPYSENTIFIYYNNENFFPYLKNILEKDTYKEVLRNKRDLMRYKSFSLGLVADETDYKFYFNLLVE